MKKPFLYILSLCISLPIHSKDLALVIGGTSGKSQENSHEFGRAFIATSLGLKASGKEVTTLFGYADMEEQMTNLDKIRQQKGVPVDFEKEKDKYFHDYKKIAEEFPKTKSITKENILDALRDNLQKGSNGDTFTLVLNAHGHVQCPGSKGGFEESGQKVFNSKNIVKSDFDPNCHHEISIASPNGGFATFRTDEIFPILNEMKKKGIEVNTIFDSCFSGILKKEVKELNDICAVYLSSGNSEGFGCFEEDPANNPDYTSTMEYVKYSTYAGIIDSLSDDPYFAESRCFNKVKDHAKLIGVDQSNTVSDSFWRARENDRTTQEPALGDSVDLSYFRQGNFSREMSFTPKLMCEENFLKHLSEIQRLIPDSSKVIFQQLYQDLKYTIAQYNQNIRKQEIVHGQFLKLSNSEKESATGIELLNKLSSLQEITANLVKEFISKERKLSPLMRITTEMVNDEVSCDRTI